jgi:hypothetical protein
MKNPININETKFTELKAAIYEEGAQISVIEAVMFSDLARDLQELLIIAHRVPDETDRHAIAEKWIRKLPDETN